MSKPTKKKKATKEAKAKKPKPVEIPEVNLKPETFEQFREDILSLMEYLDNLLTFLDYNTSKVISSLVSVIKSLYDNMLSRETFTASKYLPQINTIFLTAKIISELSLYFPLTSTEIDNAIQETKDMLCALTNMNPEFKKCPEESINLYLQMMTQGILMPPSPYIMETVRKEISKALIYTIRADTDYGRVKDAVLTLEQILSRFDLENLPYEKIEEAENILIDTNNTYVSLLRYVQSVYSIIISTKEFLLKIGLYYGANVNALTRLLESL